MSGRGVINNLRPHQLVYQAALLVIACDGALWGAPQAGAAAVGVIGVLAGMVLNDYQHRREDAAMGRVRPTQKLGKGVFVAVFAGLIALAVAIAAVVGGPLAVTTGLGTMAVTALYGGAKSARRPVLSALGRALMGTAHLATFWFLLRRPPDASFLALAMAFGWMDLAGNLAGDVRDLEVDRRAGLRTLPLTIGVPATLAVCIGMSAVGHALLLPALGIGAVATVFLTGTVAACVAYASLPRRWSHGAFHGPKTLQMLALGGLLQSWSASTLVTWLVPFGVVWLAAYGLYVWSIAPAAPRAGAA